MIFSSEIRGIAGMKNKRRNRSVDPKGDTTGNATSQADSMTPYYSWGAGKDMIIELTRDENSPKYHSTAMSLNDLPRQVSGVSTGTQEGGRAALEDLSEWVKSLCVGRVTCCSCPVGKLGGITSRFDHVDVT